MLIRNLTPTQSLFLLSPYNYKSQRLIKVAIQELILLKYFIVVESNDKQKSTYLCLGKKELNKLNQYQRFVWDCTELFIQNTSESRDDVKRLTTIKLVEEIYNNVEFNGKRFIWDYVFPSINKTLVNSKFPFYYLFKLSTKRGRRIKRRLKIVLKLLSKDFDSLRKNEPKQLTKLINELGLNIILLDNLNHIRKELLSDDNSKNITHVYNAQNVEPIIDTVDMINDVMDFEWPEFDFEFPDLSDIPFPDIDF